MVPISTICMGIVGIPMQYVWPECLLYLVQWASGDGFCQWDLLKCVLAFIVIERLQNMLGHNNDNESLPQYDYHAYKHLAIHLILESTKQWNMHRKALEDILVKDIQVNSKAKEPAKYAMSWSSLWGKLSKGCSQQYITLPYVRCRVSLQHVNWARKIKKSSPCNAPPTSPFTEHTQRAAPHAGDNDEFRRMAADWHELKRSLGAGSLGSDSKGGMVEDILEGVLDVLAEVPSRLLHSASTARQHPQCRLSEGQFMRVAPSIRVMGDRLDSQELGRDLRRARLGTGNDERKKQEGVCTPREVAMGQMWLLIG
ncbi:hypothetical protein ARMGADRAFT_1033975 [Armillaria gallica]|uniref:Uncharacterized protein n=1 Tax=Armillaria gallica TaxID=47427 RepID=A0A2H3D063_ARMGA|nr:hypothetical protein ARMGADRAFT_1033975 [Armillaria gallica]